LPEVSYGGRHSVYFVKLTLPIQYNNIQNLFIDGVTADHTIMYVQYSNGVTVRQRVLQRVVNTLNVHS